VLGGDARLVRLDPDALRGASELIPEGDKIRLHDERGQGLPGVYDAILSRGDESFHRIADDVKKRFATIRNLRLKAVSNSQKIIEVESTSGQRVPAQFMSEGLLYYLGFAAMPYLEPTSLLLVEEPENGLHPVRVAEIVDILRELSKRTQVLIATHSPLVVNELQPSEVTIVTRDPHSGTQARRLLDTPNFSERSKVYAPGELWLNYANGIDEAPLLRPDHRLDAE
jgi:predicted ATPase